MNTQKIGGTVHKVTSYVSGGETTFVFKLLSVNPAMRLLTLAIRASTVPDRQKLAVLADVEKDDRLDVTAVANVHENKPNPAGNELTTGRYFECLELHDLVVISRSHC